MRMNKIKYDKRDKRLFFALAMITTIIVVVCVVLMNIEWTIELDARVIGFVIVVAFTIFPVLAFSFWVMFADSLMYLKRLERYGYLIPSNKKEYDNNIENLVVGEIRVLSEPSKESKILAFLSWVVSVAMVVYAIFLSFRFSHMLDNVAFFILVTVVMAVLWLLFGISFWKQRRRDKFRDDVEYSSTLKPRKHLVEGIATIIILIAISSIVAVNMYTMSKYVERAKEMPEEVADARDI